MSLPLKIAARYLRSKKAHSAVNIISIISIGGVAITTAAMVCVLSVFNGFRGMITDRLSMLDPQIAITATKGKTINDSDSVIQVIKTVPGVQIALPVIEDNALAIFADFQMPVRLKGVPDDYARINDIKSAIIDGDYILRDDVSNYAVIGTGPAVKLNARPGYLRMIQLFAPRRQGRVNINDPMNAFTSDSVFTGGVFQLQQKNYDEDLIFVHIDLARELFDYTSEATQIELKLTPDANEEQVMKQINAMLGPAFTVKNRLMQQAESYKLVNMEKWITFLLLAFILIIATFNGSSALSLLIIEKDESISTLRNLGASQKQITRIFVLEGWLIALIGAGIGIVLGLILCLCQQTFGWLKLSADPSAVIIQAYPVQVEWTDVVIVFALVAFIGFLTSLVTSVIVRRRLN
jgi:ABC-type lipoprotein release transport system permease subunit